jgi:hypothetical protein
LQRHEAAGHAGDPIDIEGFDHIRDGRKIDARGRRWLRMGARRAGEQECSN